MVISSNNIPDSKGINSYYRDKSLAKLLEYYCGRELFEQVENKFIELGEVVGSELEELALSADKNPPKLKKRSRVGELSNDVEKHPDFIKIELFGNLSLVSYMITSFAKLYNSNLEFYHSYYN